MKKIIFLLTIGVLCFVNINEVSATSGYLKSNSIKTCNGVTYGRHGDGHWHVAIKNDDGRYNASGDPIYSDPCANSTNNNSNNTSNNSNTQKVVSKSSDNTIKMIKINNEQIDINDNMEYKTKQDKATIEVTLNDAKASAEYVKEKNLVIGNNLIIIKVKSENGNVKEYNLNVIREKELSNNKNIKIMVNNEEVKFTLYKNDNITISSSDDKVNITYELEDENAKVEIKGNENLKVGKNEIIITVVAENGDKQDYILNVEKYSQSTEIISTILGIVMLGGIGYGIYYFVKKRKKKQIV